MLVIFLVIPVEITLSATVYRTNVIPFEIPDSHVADRTFSSEKLTERSDTHALSATKQGEKTTQKNYLETPCYVTLVLDPAISVTHASAFQDTNHDGAYIVQKNDIFEFRFTIPAGKVAHANIGNQTVVPSILSDTIYTVKTKPLTADVTLAVTLNYAKLPSPIQVTVESINWESFLAQHDMYWTGFLTGYPNGYFSGAIMGNGLLGTNLYKENANVFRLNVGRSDITEGRIQHPVEGYKPTSHLYDEARLPIGSFRITPIGSVRGDTARLSLYDAVTRGIIATDIGRIDYRTYVHSTKNYVVWDAITTDKENAYTWTFVPDEAISPRQKMGGSYQTIDTDYAATRNPAVKNHVQDGKYTLCIQPLHTGWTYVVAWKEVKNKNARRVIATVTYQSSESTAIEVAKKTLDEAFAVEPQTLWAEHTGWWHAYYPSGFISFDNNRKIESFYWVQVYKFACASREGKPIVDIMGVWPVVRTPWCAVWTNLNTQLTYSWMAAANRSHLSQPLWKAFRDNKTNLIDNAQSTGTLYYADGSTKELDTTNDPEIIAMPRSTNFILKSKLLPELCENNQYEVANMTWLLYYYRQDCVYNNKVDELTGAFFELLTYSMNYYFRIRKKLDTDGKYHLPITASPEYPVKNVGADVNYDHATVRWGLKTLIEINDRYRLNSSKRADWQDFLDNLAPYPVGENGYKISATQDYETSHRHWSHLLHIYPYRIVNWDQSENRDLISRSIDHWQSKTGALQGYSYSGSSAMYAGMGDGERAFTQLDKLISNGMYIRPNTLYYESGNPVFETPMSAVSSLQDMYLQSWGNKIRVFHAVPQAWQEASFIDLRTEGAFLVSATRNYGKTVFIQVKSEAGGLCRLQTGMDMKHAVVRNLEGDEVDYRVVEASPGLIEVNMQKGDLIQVFNRNGVIKLPEAIRQLPLNTMKFGVNNGPAPDEWKWQLPSTLGYNGKGIF
ncbi:MAG: glycosyl hydrolase family 95 catalytic domain-containing protein [Paludibacteraceae bacterium]